jgi:hypothetical protein
MEALILKPANKEEATLLKNMVRKMKVKYAVINDEDKEDYAMARALLATKNSMPVSKETIMRKLKS